MKIVKLTYNYNWPIFRQTPNNSQIWGNYKFVIDNNLKECDYWVIYSDHNLLPEKVLCNPNNIIFISGEGKTTSPVYGQKFLDQFALIVTVNREIRHKNIIFKQTGLPWFINKTFDDLNQNIIPEKKKLISVISSNKTITEGHRKRLAFVKKLKIHFGDNLDIFGRGFLEIEDKWEALADYKYSIAIENDYCLDYVTEKFFDCLYSNTFSFYYGCPNLETYISPNSFARIDIDNLTESIKVIENTIEDSTYEKNDSTLLKEKLKSINEHQFFPFIAGILDNIKVNASKKEIILNNNIHSEYLNFRGIVLNKLRSTYRRIIKFLKF
ncbi:hypothetical protein H9W90_03780 [Polaribacter pectinis]|uniref:Fucosyltransferase C-terminal domain-containing protein n=1 Tax=Polaribacter pectinis TaxID=2738844 RepID=A0A7G9LCA1_9FLAO|nr:glycosyltransferase family 10 [Polaribacter pectinis]QNM86250.1 hypothetical protein H9W90_03780 [Polaribacter pectinis]